MSGLALVLVFGGLAGVPDLSETVRYMPFHDAFVSAQIPTGTREATENNFVLLHNGIPTRFSLDGSAPHSDERNVECGGHAPSYKVSKPKVFAYSCQVDAHIVYHVTKYGRTYRMGASFSTEQIDFTITYPAGQRDFWAPVVAHMSNSLKFAR